MHRSAGNFITLADLLDKHDARAYRLLVLQSHYRGPMEVNDGNIAAAERTLGGLDNFARRLGAVDAAPDHDTVEQFRAAMDDDFNSPPAMAVVFNAVRQANAALDREDRKTAESLGAAVLELTTMLGLPPRLSDEVDAESAALAAQRDAARAAKDWARADAIRAQLEGQGWAVQDGPAGTRLTR
jgi:cysteinyl-tRNA synthetase